MYVYVYELVYVLVGIYLSYLCINWSKLLSVTNTLCVIMIVFVGTLIFILSTEIKLGNGTIAIVYPTSYRKKLVNVAYNEQYITSLCVWIDVFAYICMCRSMSRWYMYRGI